VLEALFAPNHYQFYSSSNFSTGTALLLNWWSQAKKRKVYSCYKHLNEYRKSVIKICLILPSLIILDKNRFCPSIGIVSTVHKTALENSSDLIWFAFITGNSSLESLFECLLVQIHMDLSFRGFGRNRTGDLRTTQISVRCRALLDSAAVTNELLKIFQDPLLHLSVDKFSREFSADSCKRD